MFQYIGAVALVGGALCLDLLLIRLTNTRAAASLLFAAVLVASWQGGWGPGLLATALAALADDYFFIPPVHSLDFNPANLARITVFLGVSLLTSYLTGRRTQSLREREQLLAKERAARADAEAAIRMRDRFLAVTSHDLRTPLAAITMWADLLGQGEELPPSAHEAVDAIRRSAQMQQRLIDDLLDISRLSSGKLRLELRPVDLAELLQSSVEDLRPAAVAKQIDLQLEPVNRNGQPLLVTGDLARLRQIFANLLGNALKFTPEHGRITARLEADMDGQSARVAISDTGRGIPVAALPRVFDRFWQADATSSSPNDGLGLGLAIVRDLVQLHGGRITASSEGEGRGATFTLTLPIIPVQPRELRQNASVEGVVVPARSRARTVLPE